MFRRNGNGNGNTLFFVYSFETLAANLALPFIPSFYKLLPLLAKGSEETL